MKPTTSPTLPKKYTKEILIHEHGLHLFSPCNPSKLDVHIYKQIIYSKSSNVRLRTVAFKKMLDIGRHNSRCEKSILVISENKNTLRSLWNFML